MEEEFVPYELAVKLKELGFDEPCLGYFDAEKVFKFPGTTMYNRNFLGLLTVTAPLYQQAFRWFREKSVLNPSIMYNGIGQWDYTLEGVWSGRIWDTYEEAELACLEKLIVIVEFKSE